MEPHGNTGKEFVGVGGGGGKATKLNIYDLIMMNVPEDSSLGVMYSRRNNIAFFWKLLFKSCYIFTDSIVSYIFRLGSYLGKAAQVIILNELTLVLLNKILGFIL